MVMATELCDEVPALPLPFPLGESGEASPSAVKALVERVSGRKTAAQRSNSRQSKKDLASRYLLSSLASRAASSGSLFGE